MAINYRSLNTGLMLFAPIAIASILYIGLFIFLSSLETIYNDLFPLWGKNKNHFHNEIINIELISTLREKLSKTQSNKIKTMSESAKIAHDGGRCPWVIPFNSFCSLRQWKTNYYSLEHHGRQLDHSWG